MALPAIISGIFGLGKQFFANRAEEKQAKHERKMAVIKGDQDIDKSSVDDMRFSWKDEWMVIVITAPFVILFYGSLTKDAEIVASVKEAFEVMGTLPEWYQYSFYGVVIATLGLRGLFKWVVSRMGK